jgi:hypothetical protein
MPTSVEAPRCAGRLSHLQRFGQAGRQPWCIPYTRSIPTKRVMKRVQKQVKYVPNENFNGESAL